MELVEGHHRAVKFNHVGTEAEAEWSYAVTPLASASSESCGEVELEFEAGAGTAVLLFFEHDDERVGVVVEAEDIVVEDGEAATLLSGDSAHFKGEGSCGRRLLSCVHDLITGRCDLYDSVLHVREVLGVYFSEVLLRGGGASILVGNGVAYFLVRRAGPVDGIGGAGA